MCRISSTSVLMITIGNRFEFSRPLYQFRANGCRCGFCETFRRNNFDVLVQASIFV